MRKDLGRWVWAAVLLAPIVPAACATTSATPDGGIPDAGLPDEGPGPAHDAGLDAAKPKDGATPDAADASPKKDASDADAGDADAVDAADAGGPTVIVTGVAADSLVVDSTNVYWRASALDEAGVSFDVVVGKCAIAGGCPAGGEVLGTTTASLVFNDYVGTVALAGGKVVVPSDGTLLGCATTGCAGTLSTITSQTGTITSLSAVGTTLYFGLTGAAGSRYLESCDVGSCATPSVIGPTTGAPGDPSVASGVVAFDAQGIWVSPVGGFPDGGATLLASTNGGGPVGLWNDGTNVYFGVGGTFVTDDAGDSTLANGTGFIGRCAVTGCGGTATKLVQNESNVGGPVVSGTDVYWPVGGPVDSSGNPTAPGSIQTCSTTDACATVKTLASGGHPATIAVDTTYVYFGDPYAKTISRVAR
jgi:hypothetical protein